MANHKSAAKRARQSIRKYARNSATKGALKTVERKYRKAVSAKQTTEAQELLKNLVSRLDKAASKGVIPARRASRKISRLSSLVS